MRDNKHKNRQNFSSQERSESSNPNLTELAKKEQEYRHQLQTRHLKLQNLSFCLGQVFGLIYNLALLYLVYVLVREGEKMIAMKIFVLNIAIIAMALVFPALKRKSKNLRNHDRRKPNRYDSNRYERGGKRRVEEDRRERVQSNLNR